MTENILFTIVKSWLQIYSPMKNKKYNYLTALLLSLAFNSYAGVTDIATFKALPMVVVWGADNFSENSPTPNPSPQTSYF